MYDGIKDLGRLYVDLKGLWFSEADIKRPGVPVRQITVSGLFQTDIQDVWLLVLRCKTSVPHWRQIFRVLASLKAGVQSLWFVKADFQDLRMKAGLQGLCLLEGRCSKSMIPERQVFRAGGFLKARFHGLGFLEGRVHGLGMQVFRVYASLRAGGQWMWLLEDTCSRSTPLEGRFSGFGVLAGRLIDFGSPWRLSQWV